GGCWTNAGRVTMDLLVSHAEGIRENRRWSVSDRKHPGLARFVVYLFREGMSAERMVESYPALTLEEAHGALAFYLGNQGEIDRYLAESQREAQLQHEQSRSTNAELIAKLQRARHASRISS